MTQSVFLLCSVRGAFSRKKKQKKNTQLAVKLKGQKKIKKESKFLCHIRLELVAESLFGLCCIRLSCWLG